MAEKQFVYKTALKTLYGLTDRLIARLGEPDEYVPNPHWRGGPPASLYRIERVERWIDANAELVAAARAASAKRAARMRQAAAERRTEALGWAQAVPITLEGIDAGLPDRADRYYALSSWERGREYDGLSEGALVAYARHRCTNYEDLLQALSGQPGSAEAYTILKARVNEAVRAALEAAGVTASAVPVTEAQERLL